MNQFDFYKMKSDDEFNRFLTRIDAKGLGFLGDDGP